MKNAACCVDCCRRPLLTLLLWPHTKNETKKKELWWLDDVDDVGGVWYLEHAHGHAHPGHRDQIALHPLLARSQTPALVDQEAVVFLLL